MIRPREDLALYRADMARWDLAMRGQINGWREFYRDWVRANDACRALAATGSGTSRSASTRTSRPSPPTRQP
jgi:hypothetical protein